MCHKPSQQTLHSRLQRCKYIVVTRPAKYAIVEGRRHDLGRDERRRCDDGELETARMLTAALDRIEELLDAGDSTDEVLELILSLDDYADELVCELYLSEQQRRAKRLRNTVRALLALAAILAIAHHANPARRRSARPHRTRVAASPRAAHAPPHPLRAQESQPHKRHTRALTPDLTPEATAA